MTTREVLIAARAQIADPEHFTPDSGASDAHGNRVKATSPEAVKWCAIGALKVVQGTVLVTFDNPPYMAVCAALPDNCGGLVELARKGHAEVLAAFDKAIAEAGE